MQNNKRLLHKPLCSSLFGVVFLTLAGSPSQALTRQLSQRESLWHSDKVSGYTGDPLCGKPSPSRGKVARSDKRGSLSPQVTERARPLTMCSFYYVPLSAVW